MSSSDPDVPRIPYDGADIPDFPEDIEKPQTFNDQRIAVILQSKPFNEDEDKKPKVPPQKDKFYQPSDPKIAPPIPDDIELDIIWPIKPIVVDDNIPVYAAAFR